MASHRRVQAAIEGNTKLAVEPNRLDDRNKGDIIEDDISAINTPRKKVKRTDSVMWRPYATAYAKISTKSQLLGVFEGTTRSAESVVIVPSSRRAMISTINGR